MSGKKDTRFKPGDPRTRELARKGGAAYAARARKESGGAFEGTILDVMDTELRLECIRAYNDFLAEEYQAAAPDRLITIGVQTERDRIDLIEMLGEGAGGRVIVSPVSIDPSGRMPLRGMRIRKVRLEMLPA